MQEDFNTWNRLKQHIHHSKEYKLYHEREVWWLSLGMNIGHEQNGAGKDLQRPVLILKGFSPFVLWVVPLTTSKKRNLYYMDVGIIQGKRAAAIISQLRLVDSCRLVNKVGMLSEQAHQNVRTAIKAML